MNTARPSTSLKNGGAVFQMSTVRRQEIGTVQYAASCRCHVPRRKWYGRNV